MTTSVLAQVNLFNFYFFSLLLFDVANRYNDLNSLYYNKDG